jgi:hypothetical protein
MRRLGLGMAAGAGALAGIAAWWPPGPGQVGAMIVATAVGFVGLAVGSRDVRDLPGAGERAPGLRRIAALAPVVFGAGGAAWLGTAWAERWGAPGAWAGPGTWGIGWVAAVGARVLVSFLGGRPVKG